MPLIVESKRKKIENLRGRYPDAFIVDVTSRGEQPWVKFSPFYPHGNIPVPLSPNYFAASVEGIWQGLKVFEKTDIETSKFSITNLKGLKRSARTFGRVMGHRSGVNGTKLLSYQEARHIIYLPSYKWVLDHCLQEELARLQEKCSERLVVLLDYETNDDIENLRRPLSHASLIIKYLRQQYPDEK
jgi:hypothetical protein